MFQQLLNFPGSADLATVERIVTDEIAPSYRRSEGFRSLTTIMAPSFESTKTTVESLGAQIYPFEARQL